MNTPTAVDAMPRSLGRHLVRWVAAPLAAIGLAGSAAAGAISINVVLDTTSLLAGVTGPYSIEFQLVDGDGVANENIAVSNLQFGGGTAATSPVFTGGASGSAATGFVLQDTAFFNALVLGFNAGTNLSFHLTFEPPTSGGAGAPDRLTFAILDGSLFEVPTTGAGNELLGIDIRDPLVVETYMGVNNGTDPDLPEPAVTVSSVPEPESHWMAAMALLAMLGARRTARRRA